MKTLEEIKQNIRVRNVENHPMMPPGIYRCDVRLANGLEGDVIFGFDEEGWQHVSFAPYKQRITPSWDDMCAIKDIFWNDEEEAIQIHPKKSQYVNFKSNCLHLWSRGDLTLPE